MRSHTYLHTPLQVNLFRDWKVFEQVVRRVLKLLAKKMMPVGHIHFECKVSKAGTRGIDGVLQHEHPIFGQKIVFQAKNYTSNHDQLSIVNAFATTVKRQNAHKGLLMTTMTHFSKECHDVAREFNLVLVTAPEFKTMMNEVGLEGDLSPAAREARIKENKEKQDRMAEARVATKRQKPDASSSSAAGAASSAGGASSDAAAALSDDEEDEYYDEVL